MIDYSVGLELTGEIPPIQSDNGMIRALYDSMIQKVNRDGGKYADVVKEQSIKRKMGHLQNVYKAKGIKKSKEAIRLEAEEWYTAEYHGKPVNSNCIETITETRTETQTKPTLTGSVAEAQAEAIPLDEIKALVDEAESRGVRITNGVTRVLREELEKTSVEEILRKIRVEPNFVTRLKMWSGQL